MLISKKSMLKYPSICIFWCYKPFHVIQVHLENKEMNQHQPIDNLEVQEKKSAIDLLSVLKQVGFDWYWKATTVFIYNKKKATWLTQSSH